jgi:hypothetical protein
MKKIESIKKIYCKEYFVLVGIGFLPLLWKILEISLLSSFDNSLKILGQTALISIIFKIFEETLLNPLFKILKKDTEEINIFIAKRFFKNYLIVTLIFTCSILLSINPIMKISMIPSYLFDDCLSFSKLYVIGGGLGIISKYLLTFNIINQDTKKMFIYLLTKSLLTSLLFIILIPKIGVNAIAISELTINSLIVIYFTITFPKSNKINYLFDKKEYFKLTGISFSETLIRNIVYYFVILVLLNVIDNQDLYFISNEYIWSLMLVPTLAQSSLIKQRISNDSNHSLKPYFINCMILVIFMILLLLISPIVFNYIYNLENYTIYFLTLSKLFPCYIIFVFDSVIEAYFISKGHLKYILIQSIITNIGVYLTAFILYSCNILPITLNTIIILFNLGVIVSSTYTILTYIKKSKTI